MIDKIEMWLGLILAVVSLVGVIIRFIAKAKEWKAQKEMMLSVVKDTAVRAEIQRQIIDIIYRCQQLQISNEERLATALKEIEQICTQYGVTFDKEYWVVAVNDAVKSSNDFRDLFKSVVEKATAIIDKSKKR